MDTDQIDTYATIIEETLAKLADGPGLLGWHFTLPDGKVWHLVERAPGIPLGNRSSLDEQMAAEQRRRIFASISAERTAQDAKWGTSRARRLSLAKHCAILTEEVGEAAKEVCDHFYALELGDTEKARQHENHLVTELVQIAAVCVKTLELYPWTAAEQADDFGDYLEDPEEGEAVA